MGIIYEPHVCSQPPANRLVGQFDLVPIYDKGAIWQCDECARYWRYVVLIGDCGEWRRVRFWNLIAKHRIRKVTQ